VPLPLLEGQTLAIQIPAVVGGRAIDAMTGRRSKVNTFIRKNRKKEGLADPTGPRVEGRTAALRAAAKQQAAAKKDAGQKRLQATYVAQYQEGQPPNDGGPRGTMFTAINAVDPTIQQNMTPREIDQMIDEILTRQEQRYSSRDDANAGIMLRAIKEYRQMLETGRMSKDEGPLSTAIALVKDMLPRQSVQTPPQGGNPLPPGQNTPVDERPARVRDGIAGNRAFLDGLGTRVDESTASTVDKATLKQAIGDMRLNLGSDPVPKVKSIISKAEGNLTDKKLADQYLKPYLDRVEMQQAARKAKASRAKPKAKPNAPSQETGTGDQGGDVRPDGGTPPILETPPDEGPKVKKPTKGKTKGNLPEAEALIEVGKVGTKYENGIQDVDTALEVSRLLGITAKMMNSGTALQKAAGVGRGTIATHNWNRNKKGFGSSIFFIKPFGSYKGKKTSALDSLHSALHEMGHALTQGNLDGKGEFGMAFVKNMRKGTDPVGANSYNFSVMKPLLEAKGTDPRKNPLIAEIIAFQESAKGGFTQNNPSESIQARPDIVRYLKNIQKAEASGDEAAQQTWRRNLERFRTYTENVNELTVDPMWLYLMNPKLAKEIMPLNAKAIREEFRKAGNKKIQFYSHPFATILAAVMGMGMLASLGLEEPDEEVMPSGILTA